MTPLKIGSSGSIERTFSQHDLLSFASIMSAGLAVDTSANHGWTVGSRRSCSMSVTAELVEAFAQVTGDKNPIHLFEDFARRTTFGARIAHGMLGVGKMGALIISQLPGPGGRLKHLSVRFLAPVFLGTEMEITATIKSIDNYTMTLELLATVEDKNVITGNAVVEFRLAHRQEDLSIAGEIPTALLMRNPLIAGGLFSALLGMEKPGPGTIYLGQKFHFLVQCLQSDAPLAALAIVKDCDEQKGRATLRTFLVDQTSSVLCSGEAMVMFDPKMAALVERRSMEQAFGQN